jgi:N4-(beta-N-acetylglucosaminyl)-L-asparaginase
MSSRLSRRNWIRNSASLAAAAAAGPMAVAQRPKNIAIASINGGRACKKAMEMLQSGADTLDAVIAGVNVLELDPNEHGVGYGGLPNEDGVVELDASVMHGPTRRCGAVGGITGCKTPSKIAKLVMTETDHIMLVGEGAAKFAREMGFQTEDLMVEESRIAWLVWKRSMRDKSGQTHWSGEFYAKPGAVAELREQFPNVEEKTLAWAWNVAIHPPKGTVNCLALNAKGEMSGTTTTSGMAWKIAGRVGDSPIIGAGVYVDQDVGAAGSTGRGEENIRIAGAHTIVENMRHGMSPKDACLDAAKRVSRNFNDDKKWLAAVDINFYALRKDGVYAGAALWNAEPPANGRPGRKPMLAVNDGGESRLEPCAYLYERP